MAKNIADALAALALIEGAVTADVGDTTFETKRVYQYPPPASVALPDSPAWINSWRVEPRRSGASSLRTLIYVVRAQLLIRDADLDRGIEAATRMHMDFVDRLDGNVTLRDGDGNATVTRIDWRGADPTTGVAERGQITYAALDMFIDMMIQGGFGYA